MRIIGGRWRGRRIAIPKGTSVRPTPDRVRETVFNWLAGELTGATCLDLFAGTGVLGLEALSRGARETWFVERDAALVRALRSSIEALGANARLVQADVLAMLRGSAQPTFDVVFIDPPYRDPLEDLLASLESWLAPRALVYVERSAPRGDAVGLEAQCAGLAGARLVKQSTAGAVAFGLLRYERS